MQIHTTVDTYVFAGRDSTHGNHDGRLGSLPPVLHVHVLSGERRTVGYWSVALPQAKLRRSTSLD